MNMEIDTWKVRSWDGSVVARCGYLGFGGSSGGGVAVIGVRDAGGVKRLETAYRVRCCEVDDVGKMDDGVRLIFTMDVECDGEVLSVCLSEAIYAVGRSTVVCERGHVKFDYYRFICRLYGVKFSDDLEGAIRCDLKLVGGDIF